ncbi:hypothetical protein [Roseibium sp.]|uniref:hypothetical protein n=1 Tax=Roseibium sp. TaxID=1936156 RepID=UPI003A97C1A8
MAAETTGRGSTALTSMYAQKAKAAQDTILERGDFRSSRTKRQWPMTIEVELVAKSVSDAPSE